MNIDYAKWEFWVKTAYAISQILLWVYVYMSNRRRVTMEKIEKLENKTHQRLEDQSTRLTCLESDVRHVPTQTDLAYLSRQINEVNGFLKNLDGRLTGINRAVDLMNEYLINKADKG